MSRSERTSFALELTTDIRVALRLNRSPKHAETPFSLLVRAVLFYCWVGDLFLLEFVRSL